MNKVYIVIGWLLLLISGSLPSLAQTDSTVKRHKIALFVPLYLDSAFDVSGSYQYGKNFPKFINPGLEFYEGAQLAIDSFNKTAALLDVQVYDTRSATSSILQYAQKPDFQNVELIIGHVNSSEVRILSDIAKSKAIPFINANLPNDGGVTNNPSLVVLNSTLRTHCLGIYKFIQKNFSSSPIILFRKKGTQEDILKSYLDEAERSTTSTKLNLRVVTLNNNFTSQQLVNYLDSTRVTICVAGSLDELFAKELAQDLATLNKTFPVQVVGMPTWDGIKDFSKKEYRDLEIFYSTPFYNGKTDRISIGITNYFKNNLYSRPSDMVFRGYECVLRFGKLLLEKGANISSSIGEKKYKVFTDFDIQPALNKQTMTLDYFENRKLYFVKLVNGDIKAVY